MKQFFRLLKYGTAYKYTFIVALSCMVLETIFGGFSMLSVIPFADKILSGNPIVITTSLPLPFESHISGFVNWLNVHDRLTVLGLIAGFLMTTIFIKGCAHYFQYVLMERVGQGIVRDIRCDIFSHIQTLSLSFFTGQRTGELMSRITNDVQMLLQAISGRFANSLLQIMHLFLYIIIAIVIDWRLVIALVVLPVMVVPLIHIGRVIRRVTKKTQEKIADINSVLYEVITGISIVKAFSMEAYEREKFIKENTRYYKLRMKAVRREAIVAPLTEFVGVLIAVVVLSYSVKRVVEGSISTGMFTLQMAAFVSMVKPVKTLGKLNTLLQTALAAADRIFQILDTKGTIVELPDAVPLPDFKDEIRFKNITFAYNSGEPVLKGIDLAVRKGQIIALVGPSGVGKSTLLNLLPRFYDPTEGVIRFDGYDIKKVTIHSLRSQLGIVTQETILFNDTIYGNIVYGKHGTTRDAVIDAALASNAHQFIVNFPEGYDTVIGDRGVKLSGGERQRIAIARAILKNPAILILDEATSALDTESERLVQGAIDNLMKGRTVLVIAHRLSTVQHADKIIVLDQGRLVQEGTHKKLLEDGGLYKKLYEMQFTV